MTHKADCGQPQGHACTCWDVPEVTTANTAEPAPIPNASRPIWELVVEDMQERDRIGREKYGTPLQAGNGRDALVDAYQEALDLSVYLRKEIEERNTASHQQMVLDFHMAMGLPVGHPKHPQFSRTALRLSLLMEELSELASAVAADDLVEAADALADLEYILLGTAIEWGIDLGPVFEEVHASNMRKVGGPMRADGKKLKPPGWTPPDVAGVLAKQRGG